MEFKQSIPFKFKQTTKNQRKQLSYKYYRRSALKKVNQINMQIKDKKRARREVKLRRIHLNRYISVKHNGTKWWNKLMSIYFGHLCQEDLINIKQNTTSEIILQFQQVRTISQSYRDRFVYQQIPSLVDQSTLKFLLHGIPVNQNCEEDSTREDLYQLVVYRVDLNEESNSFEQCYISDPYAGSLAPSKKLSTIKVKNIERELDIRGEYRTNAVLSYVQSITDPSILYDCLLYQQNLLKQNQSHIDCELSLLPQKLEQIHNQNRDFWDKVLWSFTQEQERQQHLRQSCQEIQPLQIGLACKQRLLYFKRGFCDKSEDELEEALQEIQIEEKRLMFSRRVKKVNRLASYNDCKICFNPETKENNLILFCSLCHTSFHLNCYGISSPEEEENYLCDVCLWMEEHDFQQDSERPHCSVCFSRKEFPMKKVGQEFYHPTCLFFFKLANVESFAISLKQTNQMSLPTINHDKSDRCYYCLPEAKEEGLCLNCALCSIKFHPICGYLRGCKFQIDRPEQLQVRALCHFNGSEQDQIRQVYIRRFFCNFRNIQPLTEEQFKPIYQDEKHQIEIERRKLKNIQQNWKEYDTVRKRTKEIQEKESKSFNYRLMSIQQLLALGKQEENVEIEQDSADLYEEQQTKQIDFIVID